MRSLIFIDTNILLDFYRIRSREAGIAVLKKIEQHAGKLILTEQVAMEFKKNRQAAILETYKAIGQTGADGYTLPPLLSESKSSRALERHKKALRAQATKVRERLERVLQEPATYDPVFQAVQRLTKLTGPYCLFRPKKERFDVRNRARKRFILGYPPRKSSDTSIGDAINWEWIVDCCKASGAGVTIVTRDSDYGVLLSGKGVLNDWLREEFRERVSKKRKIVLTDRIAQGLKDVEITLTQQEADATTDLIPGLPTIAPASAFTTATITSGVQLTLQEVIRKLLAQDTKAAPSQRPDEGA